MTFLSATVGFAAGAAVCLLLLWWRGWLSSGRRVPPETARGPAVPTPAGASLDEVSASLPDGVAVIDAEGRVIHTNAAFRRLFRVGDETGVALSRLTGHAALDLLVRDTLETGATRQLEIDQKVEGGNARPRSRHLVVSCAPLRGDRPRVVLTARDITDSILLGQIRRDLVANVSHEIKTPLTAIRGFAETLRDGALAEPDVAIRFTGRIIQQCDRLQALLVDLLTLSRLERSETPAEPQPVDLAQVLREAIETLQSAADERRVELGARLDDRPVVHGDLEALSELFLNLIDNAIKYNENGGRVDARLSTEDGAILFEVNDTGRGIPEAALGRIFERFYRVDRGRSRQEGGTGLGLAIAKHAAELHGGRIEVESALGRGSTFRVVLPLS